MKNTADTQVKKLPITEREEHATHLIETAGNLFLQEGREYLGSFCVHIFKDTSKMTIHYFDFAVQLSLAEVEEGLADVALKELRKRMMEHYGRRAPKEVGVHDQITDRLS